MSQTLEAPHREGEAELKRLPFVPFIAITFAANAAFMFGLLAMVSWQVCLVVVLAAATLTGGVVFTAMEMRRLAKEDL